MIICTEQLAYIANQAASKQISKVFVGHNKEWKQEVNMGKQNNQQFVLLPHSRFVDMLRYKLRLLGIELIETSEEYTSKCSFVDLEPIGKKEDGEYVGSRNRRTIHFGIRERSSTQMSAALATR